MAGKDNFSNLTRTGLVSCLVMMAVLPSQCPVHRALGWRSHWSKLDLKTYCRLLVVSRGERLLVGQALAANVLLSCLIRANLFRVIHPDQNIRAFTCQRADADD